MSTMTESTFTIDYTEELVRIADALERIAVAEEAIAQCCKGGAERSEAMMDVTLNNPEATPQERWGLYDEMISGGGNAGSGQAG